MSLKITYVGHATHLIEMDGEFILTDPNFSKKVLFVSRLKEPGIKPEDLPPLSAIAITHAHFDHLDIFSFKYFSLNIPIIVPEGLGKLITKFLKNPVIEIPTWGEHTLNQLHIHSVPVKHHGFRISGLTWRGTTGYIFEKAGKKVFFPGDTAYGDHFKKIANLHKIDVALLPIGGYEPQWFMKHRHMNPAEALQALEDLKADAMIPYHWGTFRISKEAPEAPIVWLNNLLKDKPNPKVKILEPGESFER
jgi:L-ascorbate metabolism protein UlaG (beta-lactamase superfamily)